MGLGLGKSLRASVSCCLQTEHEIKKGRHCGFIALHATLAARKVLRNQHLALQLFALAQGCSLSSCLDKKLAAGSVDICLLPEMDISLPRVLHHAMHLMKTKGHARS